MEQRRFLWADRYNLRLLVFYEQRGSRFILKIRPSRCAVEVEHPLSFEGLNTRRGFMACEEEFFVIVVENTLILTSLYDINPLTKAFIEGGG
ncbi:MAG: hypothetical protein ACXV3E_07765, partial [Halobacteriota archaeon]